MSDKSGDRLLIAIIVLIASFAVFVTVSGQGATPRDNHCAIQPFDCEPEPPTWTPTPTPEEVWGQWEDTGQAEGTCATRRKEQSRTSNRGNTQTRLVPDAYGDETPPNTWTDTGRTRGSGANLEKEQSGTSSCGRTQTRWVPHEIWGPWTDTGNTRGSCADRDKEQSRTSNRGNTQTRLVPDAYGDETPPDTWTDTGRTRGSGANLEKEQSGTSSCGRTQTRWVPAPVPVLTPPSWDDYTVMAYRWIRLDWSDPERIFDTYRLEWRDAGSIGFSGWTDLSESGTPGMPRATIDPVNTLADIRGIPWSADSDGNPIGLEFRLTATTANNASVSIETIGPRSKQPDANGHQHDHNVAFDLSQLGATAFGKDVAQASRIAAAFWRLEEHIDSCAVPCDDSYTTSVVISAADREDYECWTRERGDDLRRVGCIAYFSTSGNIEYHLGHQTIYVPRTPYEDDNLSGKIEEQQYLWTRYGPLHNKPVPGTSQKYYYLDKMLLHEFGHAFGLPHFGTGIMKAYGFSITSSDRDRLEEMYEIHTKDEGW